MKIMLIMPGVGRKGNSHYVKTWTMEPLMVAQLASLTPDDVELVFYDDRIEKIPYGEDCDLVALTVETYTAKRAYAVAARFRERGIPVVMGGYHPTLVPQEVSEHADAIVIGEAEGVWKDLIADARLGNLKKQYQKSVPSLAGFFPDRSIFGCKDYVQLRLIESARGCAFSCEFCAISRFFSHTYKARPVEDFVKEMRDGGGNRFFIIDDNIVTDISRTKALLKAIEPLRIKWVGQASLQVALDPDLLKLMKRCGCVALLIGFESLNSEDLAKMNKSWNRQCGEYGDLVKRIHDNGIGIYATFVVGYEHDTDESLEKTFEFALKSKFLFAAFNHLLPFPGTRVYERLKQEGRLIKEKWWLAPDYRYGDYAFKPYHHEPEELAEICERFRKRFFSASAIFKRATNFRANLQSPAIALVYFMQNFLAEKEVEKKMGIPLGEGLDDYGTGGR
jgi:radical SAM superfamily enzyme YgiQ (UPF0313 family)